MILALLLAAAPVPAHVQPPKPPHQVTPEPEPIQPGEEIIMDPRGAYRELMGQRPQPKDWKEARKNPLAWA